MAPRITEAQLTAPIKTEPTFQQRELTAIDPRYTPNAPVTGSDVPIDPIPPSTAFEIPPTNDRPVLLTTSITVPSNSATPSNSLNLVNPDGEAMLIHEIKFAVQPYDQSVGVEAELVDGQFPRGVMTGGQFAVELKLGAIPLTNGFIPVWNFGLARFLDVEKVEPLPYDVTDYAATRLDSYYTWTLKTPLYIPAGMALSVSARNMGLTPTAGIVTVGISGVTIPDHKRNSVTVPWVSGWQSPSWEVAERGGAQSAEADMVNMFEQELFIERFSGREAMTFLPYGSVEGVAGSVVPDVSDVGTGIFDANSTLMTKMVDSSNRVLVREWTPFRNVFGFRNRAWQVSSRLPPHQFVRVIMQKNQSPAGYSRGAAQSNSVQVQVAMVGWRTVAL